MYCVKCGVKLMEGLKECPLCNTPVMTLENIDTITKTYSNKYPKEHITERYTALAVITSIMLITGLISLIVCLNIYESVSWSGYVMLGLALTYIIFFLPAWFPKWHPYIFVPVDFGAIEGFLLYICLKLNGHWFLSFAFPVVLIIAAITMGALALFKSIKKNRLFILGGLFIVIGCSCMLIELFDHITFGLEMFKWSLYCVISFSVFGLFFIIAGIIPSLKAFLERKMFF